MEKHKSVDSATNWWAEKIQKPTMFDNGDRSHVGDMASMLAFMLASQSRTNLSEE